MGTQLKLRSYKLPQDLIELLERKAAEEGTTQTELVVRGLMYVLGIDGYIDAGTANGTAKDIDELKNAVDELRTQVKELDGRLGKSNRQPAALRS